MFYGNLADLPIGDVLGGLASRQGTLIVTTNLVRIELYLDRGAVCGFTVNDREITKAHLVPKLLAKLLEVKKGDFWFASHDIRSKHYRLPLPQLMVEAVGALPDSAAVSASVSP